MQLFNGKGRALIAGLAIMAGAGVSHAYETETGAVKLIGVSSQLAVDPGYGVVMASPDPMGTGRCTPDGTINAQLDGGSSQAMYSALLAAYTAGKTVTVYYTIDDDVCNLAYVMIN